jgi:nascent polypeptide-associated complex subunit alpha
VIEEPIVSSIVVQGQRMYQVTGGATHERTPTETAPTAQFPDEDVKLVADQTGRTVDEARAALKETGGDLAEAILRLQKQKTQT